MSDIETWMNQHAYYAHDAEDMLVVPAKLVASMVEVQQARLFAAVHRAMESEYGECKWWPDASRALTQYWRIEMHKAGQPATEEV